MKKNKMMRIASVLLIVTLLSTCAISGTFAKYVTKAEGEGTARVAKWGVYIGLTGGDLFKTEYAKDTASFPDENTVISADVDCVVAPGTSNEDEPFVATITGTSEVAAQFKLVMDDVSEIMLPAGTYTDYTHLVQNADGEYGYFGTFTLEEDYYPVELTLAARFPDYGYNKTWTGTWADLQAGLNAVSAGHYHSGELTLDAPAGENMTGSFTLTWKWDFSDATADDQITDKDRADTLLGLAINETIPTPNGAVLTESFNFAASAVQID